MRIIRCDTSCRTVHNDVLERIVAAPSTIGEPVTQIDTLIKELIWTPRRVARYSRMCDLIIRHHDASFTVAELKASLSHYDDAMEQMRFGERYIRTHYAPVYDIQRKLILYNKYSGQYQWFDVTHGLHIGR